MFYDVSVTLEKHTKFVGQVIIIVIFQILILGDTSQLSAQFFFFCMAVWKEKLFTPQHFHSGNIIGILAPSSQ